MNKPFNFFDKIYCINLDERTDKWLGVQMEFEKYNLNVERFSAIKHNNGKLGLFQSTINIIKDAKNKGYSNILIFEDDVEFLNRPITDILNDAINELPSDWDIFFLSANLIKPTTPYSKHLSINNYSYGTQSYSINKKVFDYILSFESSLTNEFVKTNPIDNFISNYICGNGKTFVCKPLLTTQKPGFSDIANTNRNEYNFLNNEKINLK